MLQDYENRSARQGAKPWVVTFALSASLICSIGLLHLVAAPAGAHVVDPAGPVLA